MATALWALGLTIVASFFSAVATFFLKLAAPRMAISIRKLVRNWRLFLGLVLYGCSTILFLAALTAGELSVLYPFVALQYVWANLLSKRFLGEKIGLMKCLGVALIFIGVSLIGIGA
jgi:drug/metabolite transporter (DMT)-like permease